MAVEDRDAAALVRAQAEVALVFVSEVESADVEAFAAVLAEQLAVV